MTYHNLPQESPESEESDSESDGEWDSDVFIPDHCPGDIIDADYSDSEDDPGDPEDWWRRVPREWYDAVTNSIVVPPEFRDLYDMIVFPEGKDDYPYGSTTSAAAVAASVYVVSQLEEGGKKEKKRKRPEKKKKVGGGKKQRRKDKDEDEDEEGAKGCNVTDGMSVPVASSPSFDAPPAGGIKQPAASTCQTIPGFYADLGMELVRVTPDGACLFTSIASWIGAVHAAGGTVPGEIVCASAKDADEVRHLVVDYMVEHESDYDWRSGMVIDQGGYPGPALFVLAARG